MITSKPVQVAQVYEPLACERCGNDLLEVDFGILALARPWRGGDPSNRRCISRVYWACAGRCDEEMEAIYSHEGYYTDWELIADLSIPDVFLSWFIEIVNRINEGNVEPEAFEKIKLFILMMSQMVMRETTPEERERLQDLNMMRGF